jgi:hypothetical protein
MKRTLLLLCIVMLTCTLSFVVFAADDNTATSEYIITIPETLELDAAGTGDFTITLSDSLANGKVTITITGTSYYDGYWHLTNAEDSKLALKYTLSSNDLLYANNDALVSTSDVKVFRYDYNVHVLDQPTTAGNYTDVLTFMIDAEMAPQTYVDGLGDVKVNNPDADLNYNPDDGSVGGAVPPAAEEPEEIPELPETVIPELIKFNLGKFQQNSHYTPGTYETVPYDVTYTKIKYPVSYQNIVWSKWYVTTDENDNIINVVPSEIELADIDTKYTEYIIYNFETTEYLTMEGVAGDSVELWAPFMEQDDTLDNVIYLAAYLNKNDGCTTRHIAKWDGTKYVAVDYDANIAAVKDFTTTYTVTNYRRVEITAPSTSTEWVLIPLGEMTAAKGMTWAQWLDSEYNTTGETAPTIKTTDFEDVSYDDVIDENKEYGFIIYKLSGTWQFNEGIVDWKWSSWNQKINFKTTRSGTTIECDEIVFVPNAMIYRKDGVAQAVPYGVQMEYFEWVDYDELSIIDFGSEPQSVSQEFYEWFTTNAASVSSISGIWAFDIYADVSLPTQAMFQTIQFKDNWGTAHTAVHVSQNGIYFDKDPDTSMPRYSPDFGWEFIAHSIWHIEGTQRVSREFYDWLVANAYQVNTELSGKYQFNETVSQWAPYYTDGMEVDINFTVDEVQWNKLQLNYMLSSGMSIVYKDNANNSCTAYERNDASGTAEWKTSRIIDFGSTPQTVSLELAIWIAMNATKIA